MPVPFEMAHDVLIDAPAQLVRAVRKVACISKWADTIDPPRTELCLALVHALDALGHGGRGMWLCVSPLASSATLGDRPCAAPAPVLRRPCAAAGSPGLDALCVACDPACRSRSSGTGTDRDLRR